MAESGNDDFINIDAIQGFLEAELTARESAELSAVGSTNSWGKGDGFSKGGKSKLGSSRSTREALIAGSSGPICTFCQGSHWTDKCQKFKGLKQRKDFISINNLCFSCLETGHRSRDCKSKRPCFHCKRTGHHQAICNEDDKASQDWRKGAPKGESVIKGGGSSQKGEN